MGEFYIVNFILQIEILRMELFKMKGIKTVPAEGLDA